MSALRRCAALLRRLPRALGRGACRARACTSGNLFARDLFLWDEFPDHHDLVRGYVLEKFFIETHPDHKLAQMRAYGGLAGAEYEARDAPRFFERYLALESFDQPRHYLLAYELQRRFYVRDDQGAIGKARNLASAIQRQRADFKPLRDAVHNQISAPQIPQIRGLPRRAAPGALRERCDELIAEMRKLTSLDESALREQLPGIEDADTRAALEQRVPAEGADPAASIASLAGLMRFARQTVEAKQVSPADRRRLIDLAITAAAVIQQRGMALLESGQAMSVRQHLELMVALTDAAYGSGLLMEREREAALANLQGLLKGPSPTRDELRQRLAEASRVVEWAQRTTLYAFEEVSQPWAYLLPAISLLPDDVLRGSPLMVYGRALERLETHAAGANPIRHELFGESFERDVRALNPGVALGNASRGARARRLLAGGGAGVARDAGRSRAGRGHPDARRGERGLARAAPGPRARHPQLGARTVALRALRPPRGREGLLHRNARGARDREDRVGDDGSRSRGAGRVHRNQERSGDGALGEGGPKLHIDVERLDLEASAVVDMASMRRKDSGVRCGPKAAFLGELKHRFPDKVARGIVVPFGAYYAHYRARPWRCREASSGKGIAKPGEPLPKSSSKRPTRASSARCSRAGRTSARWRTGSDRGST